MQKILKVVGTTLSVLLIAFFVNISDVYANEKQVPVAEFLVIELLCHVYLKNGKLFRITNIYSSWFNLYVDYSNPSQLVAVEVEY